MTVDLMRYLDKWIGIPLCFIFSVMNRIVRPFSSKKAPDQIKKVLILQLSERGAVILAHSAVVKVKELFPQATLYYAIFEEMKESIQLLQTVPDDHIFNVRSQSLTGFIMSTVAMIAAVRKEKMDVVLDFELFSRISSLLSYLSGARISVGFNKFSMEGLYRGTLQTHRVSYNHLKHITLNFLSLAFALREDPGAIPLSKVAVQREDIQVPAVTSPADAQKKMLQKLQQVCPEITSEKTIIVFNPNGSVFLPLRRWPMKNYGELAQKLLRNPSVYIVVTGSQSERKDAVMFCDALRNRRCINLAGETSFRELIDLYALADLLVSNDSGPPNVAALTNIKVLVFFGPESPACYKPLGEHVEVLYADLLCSPCVSAYNHRKSPCRDNKCLQVITVDEVYEKISSLIPDCVLKAV
jgi:ADP-heptose:LPS heptosyltransferase